MFSKSITLNHTLNLSNSPVISIINRSISALNRSKTTTSRPAAATSQVHLKATFINNKAPNSSHFEHCTNSYNSSSTESSDKTAATMPY